MAKRHTAGTDLVSQIRRCQELLLARSGADEFYETIRLLIAKAICEQADGSQLVDYEMAQATLRNNVGIVSRFVEGPTELSAPDDVVTECLRVLSPTRLHDVGYEALDAAFEGMTASEYKSNKGQYFTPRHVVDFCVQVVAPRDGEIGCDPACGSAAFLRSSRAYAKASGREIQLHGYEISNRAARVASLMSYLACDDELYIDQLDSLETKSSSLISGNSLTIEDTLKRYGIRGFDFIVTNPPFAGDVSAASYQADFETARNGSQRTEKDILFIERCLSLLVDGGRMAIVLPDNKVSAKKFQWLRQWLLERARIVAVVSLHGYTFKPHTSQKACVVFLSKSKSKPEDLISFYRSDKSGKTSTGDIVHKDGMVDHDLGAIADQLMTDWN